MPRPLLGLLLALRWFVLTSVATAVASVVDLFTGLPTGPLGLLFAVSLLQAWAGSVKSSFRVAVFRPFDDAWASHAQRLWGPVLGSYGRLLLIENPREFTFAAESTWWRLPDLSDWAEAWPAPTDEWYATAEAMVDEADAAVVDVSRFSKNVRWELRMAIRVLGSSRVLVVAHRDAPVDELAVRRAANVGLIYRYSTRRADRMEFGWNVFCWMCGLTSHPSTLRVAGVVLMSAILAACLGLRLLLEGL